MAAAAPRAGEGKACPWQKLNWSVEGLPGREEGPSSTQAVFDSDSGWRKQTLQWRLQSSGADQAIWKCGIFSRAVFWDLLPHRVSCQAAVQEESLMLEERVLCTGMGKKMWHFYLFVHIIQFHFEKIKCGWHDSGLMVFKRLCAQASFGGPILILGPYTVIRV